MFPAVFQNARNAVDYFRHEIRVIPVHRRCGIDSKVEDVVEIFLHFTDILGISLHEDDPVIHGALYVALLTSMKIVKNYVMVTQADVSKAKREIGFSAKINLDKGLRLLYSSMVSSE